ncbi:MAG: MOSC domain-containing protein [Deltaproteobacteria bacterium]|jgi:MOSC domain-containing protein YiiM|nr:MOSC domain-containing protein [Deltaproteobacteria bacterium]
MNKDKFGKVVAVCLSSQKGTPKKPVGAATLLVDHGFNHDAHAGPWHRQVSLLDYSKVEEFNARGGKVTHGDFGENILVSGLDFRSIPIGAKLQVGQATLELTQHGKECHDRCQIYHRVGDCIMPREGVFARVLVGGEVKDGDEVVLINSETKIPAKSAEQAA